MGNPDPMEVPFWDWMIRNPSHPFFLPEQYGLESLSTRPIWTFQRIGQSHTFVNGDRLVSIGGEYDDSYDPDFQIYNDVVVRDFRGNITVFGYPRDVFPPTDFHTATLIQERSSYASVDSEGGSIILIGSIGYPEDREFWTTPVYHLNLDEFWIRRLDASGDGPGWISDHTAMLAGPHQIRICGGRTLTEDDSFLVNTNEFELDLETLKWTRLPGTPL